MAVQLLDYIGNITNGSATSITLTKPPCVPGDLLILLVGNENSANGEGVGTVPGWFQLSSVGSGGTDCYSAAFYRICDGTEPATVVVPFLASDDGFGWYTRFGVGVDTSNPINAIEVVSATTVGTSIYVGNYPAPVPGSMAISFMAYDGGDAGGFNVDQGQLKIEELVSPSGGGGNAASGAFSIYSNMPGTILTGPTWTWAKSDGAVATQFVINAVAEQFGSASIQSTSIVSVEGDYTPPIFGSASILSAASLLVDGEVTYLLQLGNASLTATSTVLADSYYYLPGSVSLTTVGNLLIEGDYTPPIYGSASLLGQAAWNLNQTIRFEFVVTFKGKAQLARSSSFIVEGQAFGAQKGSATLLRSVSFTAAGDWTGGEFIGAASIYSYGDLILDGIVTEPTPGRRMDDLEARVTELEDLINDVPEGLDFLKSIDIDSFFTASQRGFLNGL